MPTERRNTVMKNLIVATLSLAILFCGSAAFAGPRGSGQGMGPGMGGAGCDAAELNLTEEQSDKLQSLRETYLKEITPLQSRMFAARSEMRLLWNTADPDRDQIVAKQKAISELKSQLEEKAIAHRLDCRAVLTPEQRSQMAAAGPGMGTGRGSCMGNGKGPGSMHRGRW
jgi:Spy/CpxP family protein refolding chaperone